MNESWKKAVASWTGGPKRKYWDRVVHLLLDEGAQPLPAEHVEVEEALEDLRKTCYSKDLNMEEFLEGLLGEGKFAFGWVLFENHERTMPISDFITEDLPARIVFKNYWLLPVFDDQEWISWTFIFVPKDVKKVMEAIKIVKEDVLSC